jgi:hypothetical protein
MSDLTAEEWNAKYPVGTLVRFDNTTQGGGSVIAARTASAAIDASSMFTQSKWVVHLEGHGDDCFGSACISVVELPDGPAPGAGAKSDLIRLAEAIEALVSTLRGERAEFWRQAAGTDPGPRLRVTGSS